jgi:cyclohexyl-isocyanide hydratase
MAASTAPPHDAAMHIGMLLYPGLTQLDLTAPYEALSTIPGAQMHLVWKDTALVRADSGLGLAPTTSMDACPPLDVVFVPGGMGQTPLMTDAAVLAFLRHHGRTARYVTSVCGGSLLLGAAGLLEGYQATTHWAFTDLLPTFGARYVNERVVVDRNRITGGGVTAGLDFGIRLVAELSGEPAARALELALEYDPSPPFRCGRPDLAEPALVEEVRARLVARIAVTA